MARGNTCTKVTTCTDMIDEIIKYIRKVSAPSRKRSYFVKAMRALDMWARECVKGQYKYRACHNFNLIIHGGEGAMLERNEPGRHEIHRCSELEEYSTAVRGYLMYSLEDELPRIIEEVKIKEGLK